ATLIIPRDGQPATSAPSPSMAMLALPKPGAATASTRIEATALDRLPPVRAEKPPVTAGAPPTATVTEPARPDPKPPAATAAPNAAASPEPPTAAPAAQVHGTGVFQWPVRGHVLVG